MSVVDFRNILKFFGGSEPTPEEQQALFKEAALMALARATSADTNIKQIELERVQALLKKSTGDDYTVAEIRTAAKSEVFETQPLEKYLSGVGKKLGRAHRIAIVELLARVIRSDDRISNLETDYFDMVANALGCTPSEVAGLMIEED